MYLHSFKCKSSFFNFSGTSFILISRASSVICSAQSIISSSVDPATKQWGFDFFQGTDILGRGDTVQLIIIKYTVWIVDLSIYFTKPHPSVPKKKPKSPNKTHGVRRRSLPVKQAVPSTPHRPKRNLRPSKILFRAWPIHGSEQAYNAVQAVYYMTTKSTVTFITRFYEYFSLTF